jgi:HEAT repeat protein
MLNRPRYILLLVTCLVLLGVVAAFFFSHPREPSYGGRSLRSWLADVAIADLSAKGQAGVDVAVRRNAAIDALRHMGPEAALAIVEMLKVDDGRLKKAILIKLGKHRYKLGLLTAEEKRSQVRATLLMLGTNATIAWRQILMEPAISEEIRLSATYQYKTVPADAPQIVPAMVQLLADLQPEWRNPVRAAITKFGPEVAVPVLARQLQDKHRQIQLSAMSAIKYFGSSARLAAPALTQGLNSPDKEVALTAADTLLTVAPHNVPALLYRMHHGDLALRTGAYWSLAHEQSDPLTAIPELMRGLTDPEPEIRQAAVEGLTQYGTNAQPALPGLTNLLNDPKRYVRRATTNAINSIADLK